MPLDLSEEDIDSIRSGGFVSGTGVSQLVHSYNADQYSVERGVVTTNEALAHQLENIPNGTNRIVLMHVNVLNQGFIDNEDNSERRNHYVGLRVSRQDDGRYAVQYIDPMGREINHDIRSIINNSLGEDNIRAFQQYNGRLQYSNIIGKNDSAYADGNYNDCGTILVYLMTKAARGNPINSIGSSSHETESREIGQGLRRIFLRDNTSVINRELSSLNVSQIRAIGQSTQDVSKQESKSRRISNASAIRNSLTTGSVNLKASQKEPMRIPTAVAISSYTSESKLSKKSKTISIKTPDSDIKRRVAAPSTSEKSVTITERKQGDRPERRQTAGVTPIRLGRETRNPEVINRRLDSIAHIISGESACAAVAFDGEKILVANNDNDCTKLTKDLFTLLGNIATSNMTKDEIKRDSSLQKMISDIQAEAIRLHAPQIKNQLQRDKYRNKVPKDLAKVVNSLAIDCEESKRFPEAYRAAFSRGFSRTKNPEHGQIVFVQGLEVETEEINNKGKRIKRKLHAEMAILDRVVSEENLEVKDKDIKQGTKPFYMGITKLCCRDCALAIRALNQESQTNVQGSTIDSQNLQSLVSTRGEHYQQFPWVRPEYFIRRPNVEARYDAMKEEIKRKIILFTPGAMLGDSSESSISNDSSISSKKGERKENTSKSNAGERSTKTIVAALLRRNSPSIGHSSESTLSPDHTPSVSRNASPSRSRSNSV